ncbi:MULTISPECIES: glycosyltransferase family 2 protein [Paenibacillus]|uniref:Glycosyl transferase family 2 n=1 Tax=Paenibacillus polymyxa (strain SC2) TaxID=886882 RepID=E3EAL2_PAEPS|nr:MULTISPECIES: glycosyltransferase family 2 protein [Paenibacillus]ADO58770.1 glycosyl transferase family 2 [Paenibacillus polymyxa SC2]KZE68289.1 glycosyl transferase family 2 [Paenibacillus jamilae]WPQ56386.1 glycosyltransferase family 2 protein [Paenibacillus polymyxa]
MSIKFYLKNVFFPMLAGILGIRKILKLVPVNHLIKDNGNWVSTGDDPAFVFQGKFYVGWNQINWSSNSEEYTPLKLYWNDGSGYSEVNSVIFSFISPTGAKQTSTLFIPPGVQELRLDPGEKETVFELSDFEFKKITKIHIVFQAMKKLLLQRGSNVGTIKKLIIKATYVIRKHGIRGFWSTIKNNADLTLTNVLENYQLWVAKNRISPQQKINIRHEIEMFTYKPLISVIMPVYNVEEIWLRKCIDSVIEQLYPYWELCISDDASSKEHIKRVLTEYQERDSRIKVSFREKNGHISESSNSAIEISDGEFIALLDHDDELASDALYQNVKILNENPSLDFIYSDEDKIGVDGERHSPYFKPDWSPDLILSQMYTCHLGVYRKSLVTKIGGFRQGYEGSQDFDLVLRLTELTNKIYHIPKILYHWRTIPESTASGASAKNYTHYAGIKALQDTLQRRNIKGTIEELDNYPNMYRIHYDVEREPLVSIIIPTKDMSSILDSCLESIFLKTTYLNFEIIIVDNGSTEQTTFDVFAKWKDQHPDKVSILTLDIPFNYSKLNNSAVEIARGELLLFLNNDIEVIDANWLEEMIGYASRGNTGAVGAKLLYPDKTIQHSGVIMGLGGVAGHAFRTALDTDPGYFGALMVNRNVSVVTAACLMIKKEIFSEVNGFEEDLSVAFNDVDFCLKVLEKGYYNITLNSIKLYHHESKTRGLENTTEKIKRFQSEIDYMHAHWPAYINYDPFYNVNLSLEGDCSYRIKNI